MLLLKYRVSTCGRSGQTRPAITRALLQAVLLAAAEPKGESAISKAPIGIQMGVLEARRILQTESSIRSKPMSGPDQRKSNA